MKKIGTHPSIINIMDILEKKEVAFIKKGKKKSQMANAIVMEMGKIDLFGVITKCQNFTEATCRFYFKQLLRGIEHCH